MIEAELKIKERAEEYAKKNKVRIAKEKTSVSIYPKEENPVSVFMAGSPGAGKTESSRNLLKELTMSGGNVIRIDPDDLRSLFDEYIGTNSSLFHTAVSFIVEKIHDLALHNSQSFIFDGTLSKFEKAKQNIERSLSKKRFIQILYVYQDPLLAWKFVKKREKIEGRNIPKDTFIEQYFAAHTTVNALKKEFKENIQLSLIIKNNDASDQSYHANIDSIDGHVIEKYTRDTLQELLE